MHTLRAPGGCPWDREQDFDSIKPYTLEEVYEVFDSIDARDWKALADELGDLLLQCVFYAQMAGEEGHFSIDDSLDAVNEKLIRRHPHVFSDGDADTAGKVKKRWDEIKAEEKKERNQTPKAILDTVSRSQPALAEAAQISSKVAAVGFDWEHIDHVMDKLHEELDELAEARTTGAPREHVEDELGDILFVTANIARHLKVDPEQSLRRANAKFRRRFGYIENALKARDATLDAASLEEMESLWQEAKSRE